MKAARDNLATRILFVVVLASLCSGQQPKTPAPQGTPSSKASPSPAKVDLQPLAKNAPQDQPHSFTDLGKLEQLIAPYVEKARATLPQTRKRFQAGLQKGEVLFVTIRLDEQNKTSGRHLVEMVFLEVKSWDDKSIRGLLSTDPDLVKSHHRGDKLEVAEKDVLDWTISRPDGSEDGNFVGKFLDSQH